MSKIVAFVDSVGRTILGELQDEKKSSEYLNVKNPAIVNVQVVQNSGQIQIQLLPFVFREFIKADTRDNGNVWQFNKSNTVFCDDLELEDNIIQQYDNIFNAPAATAVPQAPASDGGEPDVIKLFDD